MAVDAVQKAAARAAAGASGAVVRVGRGRRGGCGVLIGQGRILTNAHNVRRDETVIQRLDGATVDARAVGVDIDGDLAVLEADIEGAGLTYSSTAASIGLPVLAVGLAPRGPRVTAGRVSAVGQSFRGPRGRRISGSIEHTAPLAPGSSGSPLLDLDGALIGLNTNRLGSGFYQAIPMDEATRARIDRLAAGEHIERPRLGLAIAPSWVAQRMRAAVGLRPRPGVLVREVEEGSRAAAAGILVGDLIVAVGDRPVDDPDDLGEAIERASGPLAIRLVRGEDELEVTVELG